MKFKEILEEYQEKSFKYDLMMKKIDEKLERSERRLKNTNSEIKKIILDAKICFLKDLKKIDEVDK